MMTRPTTLHLRGRRVTLRPLHPDDFEAWREVRKRCAGWLLKWEPRPAAGQLDPVEDRRAFVARCGARDRERDLGVGFGFGIFLDSRFCGEINLSTIQRGAFQNAYIGYWIDEAVAGNGYMPESVVVLLKFAFEELKLHRVQISIIPRNTASRRVVEKLDLRDEGTAIRYLQINGIWEDHVRYAITAEEWVARKHDLAALWL